MKKSFIALLVLAVLCLSSLTVFAATFSDVSSSHWASKSITRLSAEEIINGDGNGNYRPEDEVSRAEFVTMLMRVFEPEAKANLSSYKDVDSNAWYYDYIAKAVAMPAITGDSESSMRPEDSISRQEAMVVINRIMELVASDEANLERFSDYNTIASWAKDAVTALTEGGYVNGYEDGTVRPTRYITRAEVAKLLDEAIAMIITDAGEYDLKGYTGIVVVKAKNVSLTNTDGIDKIFALNDEVADTLKVGGKNVSKDDVSVINSTKKNDEKKSSSGGAIVTPKIMITLNETTGLYKFTKSGAVANNKTIKFVVDGKEVTTAKLSATTFEGILDQLLAKVDEDKLAKTLASEYKDNALVKKMADKIWEKVTDADAKADAKDDGYGETRYDTMYEVYSILKLAGVDVVSLAKEAIDYNTDISSALALLK
ncbi:MAG: S-layer homology domain-containing protein [Clostridia bacterium]|nr:S-layer homology domain-containing protein [Clostridia bacterium]